jgi:PAS domain S-box-containing protein
MTILIVDDNEPDLYQLQVLLGGNGYQVVTAVNGAKALTKARQNPPDLIVSDILMPVMDGFALCREWKKDERLRQIPFVFYTATYTDERDREFALSLGAEQFLVKPQEPEVFIRTIREVIQQVQRPPAPPARLPVQVPQEEEAGYLKQYNEALIRKLEAKMQQLEQANRELGRDITERKRAEAENARLATAIEQSAEAVVITDIKGTIQYMNPAFSQITGYSREEVLGQNPRILKSGHQDPVFYQQLWGTILKGEIWRGELVNRRKDGSLYTEEMNIAPVRNPSGEVTHFIAAKRDVTAHRELEQQLWQAQKMEAVGRLAGGVAHDFNNLLTIINGYSQLILESLEPNSTLTSLAAEIQKAGERAAALTRQLLAFSRRQVLAPEILDLNDVITNIEKMLRRLIGEDIELRPLRHPALGHVRADRGQVEQVIMNLVLNARDAMPQGGTLTIETANVYLDAAYARTHANITPGYYVVLIVSDSGMGMGLETQAHIFEPFFSTKERGKGTGLGLATVYGIVKQSGGHIWVYSEPGRGATFKVYFPRVEAEAAPRQPTEVRAEIRKGTETILLVEDETAVLELAARVLQSNGYKVLAASDPEEAVRVCEEYKEAIHLLLTDVVMPKLSGRRLADHVVFIRPEMKVLYMSGYTDDTIVHQGVIHEGAAFLEKPFTPENLLRKVRGVLAL